jgi:hypothetical protein
MLRTCITGVLPFVALVKLLDRRTVQGAACLTQAGVQLYTKLLCDVSVLPLG